MNAVETFDGGAANAAVAARRRALAATPDDKEMLRAAAELTRDIAVHRPAVYWADMLALYRALLFIHEISHFRKNEVPGFRLGWNIIVGIPILTPSLMYEAVHTLHHARTRYGTREDPEYLPLALMKPWSLPLFVLVALLAPVGFLIRFGILAPLSLVVPGLRRLVWERFSALWENEGEAMTVTGQYLDSVNVPPPSPLAVLWAPVGLRYHALHHLMPSMPYHSLGKAHARLCDHLGADSTYLRSSHRGMAPLVVRIARSTMRRK